MNIFQITDNGVNKTTVIDGDVSTTKISNSSGNLSLLVEDGKNPYIVFLDSETRTLYKLDANTEDVLQSFYYKYFIDVKSIQVDYATGDIYLLQTYQIINNPNMDDIDESTSSVMPSPYREPEETTLGGGLLKIDSTFSVVQGVNITNNLGNVYLRFPQDFKIDSVGRRLIIANTGSHQVLDVNLNNYVVNKVVRNENMILPSSISVSQLGDIFVVYYDKTSFKQVTSSFSSGNLTASFYTNNDIGLSNYFYGEESDDSTLLVLDKTSAYEVDPSSGTKETWHTITKTGVNSIATSWTSGSTAIKYDDGTIEKFYKYRNLFGDERHINKTGYTNPKLIANHLEDAFFSIYYNSTKRKFSVKKIYIIEPDKEVNYDLNVYFSNPVCGDSCFLNGTLYLLVDKGQKIIKVNPNYKNIVKEKSLDSVVNLISVCPKEEKIWLANKTSKSFGYIDKNLNEFRAVDFLPDEISSIQYDMWDEDYVWLTSKNVIYRYKTSDNTFKSLTIGTEGLIKIVPTTGSFVWAFDKKNVYRINNTCELLVGSTVGFTDAKDISCINFTKNMYANGYLPQSNHIKYDDGKNRLAWLYKDELYLVDTKYKTGVSINNFLINESTSYSGDESTQSSESISSQSSLSSTSSAPVSSLNSSSVSTEILTSSLSSTIVKSTSSSLSSSSTESSSSSSTGIEFYIVPEDISFSNYGAIGQTYGGNGTDICLSQTGPYAINTEKRYGYLAENPNIRLRYWDSSYLFKVENQPHGSGTIFVNFKDSGNLHLKDPNFVNIMIDDEMREIAYDYPCWGIRRLWVNCYKSNDDYAGGIWLPINPSEISYRWDVTYLDSENYLIEGDGETYDGRAWIGRNRNVSITYKLNGLPEHSYISIYADMHLRGNWLGVAEQTIWTYKDGSTEIVNPYTEGYGVPSGVIESKQALSMGRHCLTILAK